MARARGAARGGGGSQRVLALGGKTPSEVLYLLLPAGCPTASGSATKAAVPNSRTSRWFTKQFSRMGRRCSAGARKARVCPNRQSSLQPSRDSLHLSHCRSSYCTEANKKWICTKIIIQLWFAARSRRHRSLPTSHCPLSPFCRGQPPPPSSPPCLALLRPRRGRALDLPRAPRALGVVRCACAREGGGSAYPVAPRAEQTCCRSSPRALPTGPPSPRCGWA